MQGHTHSSRRWIWTIAALCLVRLGAFGCMFDPSGSVATDGSVLHELFPEIFAVTGVALPDGTIGGLAYGDFDCDGEPDLAIGDPDQPVSGSENAGVVHLFYANGEIQKLTQGTIDDTPIQQGAAFGLSLAAGDFNGTGCDDLAIGAPGFGSAGRVDVVRGYDGYGLFPGDSQSLNGIQTGEAYGTALAAGRFDADDRVDLAVGIPRKRVDGADDAGSVEVFYGGLAGFTSSVFFSQDHWYLSDVAGAPEEYDLFGFSLVAGDFDGNGTDDLAVGAPGECSETVLGVCQSPALPDGDRGGAVNVFYSVASGLQVNQPGDQLWSQKSSEVKGDPEDGDAFGFSLATGDFDGDGYRDLAVGVPGEDIHGDTMADGGSVNVLYGSRDGLQSDASAGGRQDQLWNLDCSNSGTCGSHDIAGMAVSGVVFGVALAAGDFDADGRYDDLAVGVPRYVHPGSNGGAVSLILGGPNGLDTPGSQLWHQDSSGVADTPDWGDSFGAALAVRPGPSGDALAVRVNDGDPCAVNLLFASTQPDFFVCSADGVPLFTDPDLVVGPGGELYEEPGPFEDPLPGTLTYGDDPVLVDPSTLDEPIRLAAAPGLVRPGQTIAVSWEATGSGSTSDDEIGGATTEYTTTYSLATTSYTTMTFTTSSTDTTTTSGVIGSVDGGPGGEEVLPVAPSALDWVGLFEPAAANPEPVEWHYTDAVENGFLLFTAPEAVGAYEFRYLLDNGYEDLATSNPVLVVPAVSLAVSPETAVEGDIIEVCWEVVAGQPFGTRDWLGLFAFGASNQAFEDWGYTDGDHGGCISFPAPAVESRVRYQLRYLLDDGFEHVAAVDVAVDPAPTPTEKPHCGLGSHLPPLLLGLLWWRRARARRG